MGLVFLAMSQREDKRAEWMKDQREEREKEEKGRQGIFNSEWAH